MTEHKWQPWRGALIDMLMLTGLAASKREARQLIAAGAISVNNRRITDVEHVLDGQDAIEQQVFLLRRGKHHWHLLKLPPPVRLMVVEDETLDDGTIHIDVRQETP